MGPAFDWLNLCKILCAIGAGIGGFIPNSVSKYDSFTLHCGMPIVEDDREDHIHAGHLQEPSVIPNSTATVFFTFIMWHLCKLFYSVFKKGPFCI